MGLFSKIAKGVGFVALSVVSPGAATGIMYQLGKKRAEDIATLKSDLDELLKATAEYLESDESSEFLTFVQNAAMRVISDDDGRKALMKEVGQSPKLFINTICAALLRNDTTKSFACSKGVDIEEVEVFMVGIPRALVNTAVECFKEMNIPEGKEFDLLRAATTSWLIMPKEAWGMVSVCDSNLRITVSKLMENITEIPEVKKVLLDVGFTEAKFKQGLMAFAANSK